MLGVRKFNETFAHTLRSQSHGAIHQHLQRLLRAPLDTHLHAIHLGKQRRVRQHHLGAARKAAHCWLNVRLVGGEVGLFLRRAGLL